MSPEPSDQQIPPPKDWQIFERHVRDLFEAEWGPPVELNGRTGQPQHGVDIYGQPNGGKAWYGIQCKQKNGLCDSTVTEAELREEANKAKGFKPKLAHFILATTGLRDETVQKVARQLTEQEDPHFSVRVAFWDDILDVYDRHKGVFGQHYPGYVRRQTIAPHQLRPPTTDFTGREAELETLLSKVQTGATISGLQGMGGVGKTELAYVVANRLSGRYPDAQILVELKGTSDKPLSPADALSRVIQSIQPEAKLPEEVGELQKIYLSLLHGKRAIILADDAASAEQVRPLMPPAGSFLLVTSRRHFRVQGLEPVQLNCLGPDEAVELLLKICQRIDGCAAAIAKACGYLPQALRAAASLLAVRPDIQTEDYVRDLVDETKRLETIGQEGVEIGVEASLMLSYRQLEPETGAGTPPASGVPRDVQCGGRGGSLPG